MAPIAAHTDERGRVAVLDPTTGERGWVPGENAQAAVQSGFKPLTPAEYRQAVEAEEYDARNVAAGAAGVARGLTFGLSDVAAPALGIASPETLRKLEEYNPAVSGIAEGVGATAGMLLPGAPLARAGQLGARAAGAVAAKAGTSLAGRLAGGAARAALPAAAEGVLLGAGHGVSRAALSEREMGAKEVAGTIAKEAALGAGVSGIMGLGFGGVAATAKGAIRLTKTALTAGRKPSELALSAQRALEEGGEGLVGTSGADRLMTLREEINRTATMRKELTRQQRFEGKDNSQLIAQMDAQLGLLRKESSQVTRELTAKVRPDSATAKTVTKTTFKPGTKAETAAESIDDLTADEMRSFLTQDHAEIVNTWRQVVAAKEQMRSQTLRLFKEGADDLAMSAERVNYEAYLDRMHHVLYKRKGQVNRWLDELETVFYESEGRQAVTSGLVPSGKTVTETVTRKAARAAAEPDLAARDAVLASARPDIPREMLESFSKMQTPGVLEKYLDWRSAGTLMGWILGGPVGAILGGPIGGSRFAREVLLEPAFAGAASIARTAAAKASGIAGRLPGALPAAMFEASYLTGLYQEVHSEYRDPERVYRQAVSGYTRAGMDDSDAHQMAKMQAARADIMRKEVPAPHQLKDKTKMNRYKRVMDAVSDPRRIGYRLRKGEQTAEDMMVFKRMFPEQGGGMENAARRILDDPTADIGAKERRGLEIIAGRTQRTFARLSLLQDAHKRAAAKDQEQQAQFKGPQRSITAGATTMQRISAGG